MNGEMVCINVELAQRTYKVNVRESEKTVFEDASKMIDETIKGYEAKYAYKDKQDLLAMVLLQYVTAFIKQNRTLNDNNRTLTERLEAMLQNLEKSI